ncbi:MAG TPA: GNAT family protein [Pyrinomonadaceae bacterium]|nr:GNAT family protein [Pyrinomonadaceae bacterium]
MTKNRETGSRSQKVFLRHPADSDFEELRERFRTSRKHLRGFASSRFDRDAFARLLAGAKLETNECFLICRTLDSAVCGQINFSQIFRRGFQSAYLGYQLFHRFTGHGYMTEAVGLALGHAFNELRLHRVEANVQPNNSPSIAVLERNGFVKEGFSRRYLKIGGRWRDHERWAIIKEDWIENRTNGRNRT